MFTHTLPPLIRRILSQIKTLDFAPQTREQEELEELLLLEQQGNEQRRLELLQEEQRQLQAKRKNKQALLDELVRNTSCMYVHVNGSPV